MENNKIVSAAMLLALLLSGCGGGGDSTTEKKVTWERSVTVIDGYLENAVVWLDQDDDGVLDSNEPSARTNASGQATLKGETSANATPAIHRLMVQAIAGETKDRGDGTGAPVTVARTYLMSAPGNYNLVTPFTTLIDQTMRANIGSTSEEAASKVASDLGLESSQVEVLHTDFMAGKDYQSQLYATQIATLLPEKLDESTRGTLLQQAGQVGKVIGGYLEENPSAAASAMPEVKVVLVEGGKAEINDKPQQLLTHMDEDTHGAVLLKRDAQRKVTQGTDGSVVVEESGVDYYWDRMTKDVERLNGQPLRYREFTRTETRQADGQFVRQLTWKKDLNKDGQLQLLGQAFEQGKRTAQGETFWSFIDQGGVNVERNAVVLPQYEIYEPVYDGQDLQAAVAAKDYSQVDLALRVTVTRQEESTVTQTEFFVAPKDIPEAVTTRQWADWLKIDDEEIQPKATYGETLTTQGQESGAMTADLLIDWNNDGTVNGHYQLLRKADGTLVESSEAPVYAAPLDSQFEEYADYNWQQPAIKTEYWYEKSRSSSLVDGKLVTRMSGHRYLLDIYKAQKLVSDEAPQGIEFNKYSSITTDVSDSEQRLYASWINYHRDGYDFTADTTEPGQQYVVTLKGANDLWVGHRFAEWGSREVADLADKVEALRTQGVALEKIDASLLPGLSNYNGQLLTSSFRYDANHQPRTWYWVTNRDLKTGGTLETGWKKIKLKLVNNGYKQWLINDTDGALIFTIPNRSAPYNWYTSYDTVAVAASAIGTRSGHMATWAGDFFLDESEADEFLAQKKTN